VITINRTTEHLLRPEASIPLNLALLRRPALLTGSPTSKIRKIRSGRASGLGPTQLAVANILKRGSLGRANAHRHERELRSVLYRTRISRHGAPLLGGGTDRCLREAACHRPAMMLGLAGLQEQLSTTQMAWRGGHPSCQTACGFSTAPRINEPVGGWGTPRAGDGVCSPRRRQQGHGSWPECEALIRQRRVELCDGDVRRKRWPWWKRRPERTPFLLAIPQSHWAPMA